MNITHLSAWEQEECVIGGPTAAMDRHLAECAGCRAAVDRLQQGTALYRKAAVAWSAGSLAARPAWGAVAPRERSAGALRWTFAAAIPLLCLVLGLLGFRLLGFRFSRPPAARPVASISDDALLEQVDQQLSVAVPDSMESLTHLVTTKASGGAAMDAGAPGGKHIVQTN